MPTRGVTNPVFAGSGSGTGTTTKGELELLGSGSLLESDPPMESALFGVCTSLILIQEAPSV